MKRRNFFATLAAPLVAKVCPSWGQSQAKSACRDELYAYPLQHIPPAMMDNIYAQSSICMRLHAQKYFDDEPARDYMGTER